MKKILLSLLVLSGMSYSTYAQTDEKAKVILTEVSKKYRSYNTIRADFSFIIENKQANSKETQKGTLYVKADANKYKVIMEDQDLISDGKSQWTYLKKDKEVQVSNADNNEEALHPARIFTIYESGFKYLYTGETKVGSKVYQMIDLSPTDTKKSYYKIRLSIDKAAKRIANVLILDKNGNRYTYTVKTFIPNPKVPENIFAFDTKKYPGVEVVDLR